MKVLDFTISIIQWNGVWGCLTVYWNEQLKVIDSTIVYLRCEFERLIMFSKNVFCGATKPRRPPGIFFVFYMLFALSIRTIRSIKLVIETLMLSFVRRSLCRCRICCSCRNTLPNAVFTWTNSSIQHTEYRLARSSSSNGWCFVFNIFYCNALYCYGLVVERVYGCWMTSMHSLT